MRLFVAAVLAAFVFVAAVLAAFVVSEAAAQGRLPQQGCKNIDAVRNELAMRHQEALGMSLLSKRGYMLEFFGDLNDGSWTAVRVTPAGCATHLDEGDYFRWHDSIYGPIA